MSIYTRLDLPEVQMPKLGFPPPPKEGLFDSLIIGNQEANQITAVLECFQVESNNLLPLMFIQIPLVSELFIFYRFTYMFDSFKFLFYAAVHYPMDPYVTEI